MSRPETRRRGTALVTLLLAVAPLAAACGVGQLAETTKEQFPPYGSFYQLGDLKLDTVHLQPVSGSDQVNGSAYLVMSVFNGSQDDDQIVQVTTEGGGTVSASTPTPSMATTSLPPLTTSASGSPSGSASPSPSASLSASPSAAPSSQGGGGQSPLPITVPAGGGVKIGPGPGEIRVVINNLPGNLRVGSLVSLTVVSQHNGATRAFPVPVDAPGGTDQVQTPMSYSPTSPEPEHVDPQWSKPPYDDRGPGEQGQPQQGPCSAIGNC